MVRRQKDAAPRCNGVVGSMMDHRAAGQSRVAVSPSREQRANGLTVLRWGVAATTAALRRLVGLLLSALVHIVWVHVLLVHCCPDCFARPRPGRWWAAGFRPSALLLIERIAGWLKAGWRRATAHPWPVACEPWRTLVTLGMVAGALIALALHGLALRLAPIRLASVGLNAFSESQVAIMHSVH
jgi:hypothetical protein